MPLDLQAAELLKTFPNGFFSDSTVPPADMRERMRTMMESAVPKGEMIPIREVRDAEVPGPAGKIPVRIYVPAPGNSPPQAGVVYFHGGGFVTGNLDSHDAVCRALASMTPCTVISVDYRLAPEHPFPAAVDDAFAATKWVADNAQSLGIDPHRIAVAGDSAGGNLSAVVSLLAKRLGGPAIAFQLLFYPATGGDPARHPSLNEFSSGYFLTASDMKFFYEAYLGKDMGFIKDDRAAPLLARDLAGLPPCRLVTAEFDPLRDEGADYARHLEAAGVPTEYKCYEGQLHGFISMAGVVRSAAVAFEECVKALAKALDMPSANASVLSAEA